MELGLSLGETSKPSFGFMEKARDVSNKGSLGFCMGLSIAPNLRNEHDQEQEQEDDDDDDDDTHEEKEKHINDSTTIDTATTTTLIIRKAPMDLVEIDDHQHQKDSSMDSPVIQLDLLPNTPVQCHRHALLLPSSGGCEEGSYTTKGLDVNRVPAAEEAEGGAAVSSSPPNSKGSSFQMDFCIYSKSGNHEAERASSRASDEDENGSTRKKLRLSKEQAAFLEESFKEHNTLNPKQKLALAKQLNLRSRQVEVWFQNRRARTKLKQTEVDCEYLKRCCETLTEENRRLHKELQELRALKTSNPFCMQLPATTLTMCPSCERVATSTANATATTTAANPTTKNNNTESISKATGLSLGTGPRFYPSNQSKD